MSKPRSSPPRMSRRKPKRISYGTPQDIPYPPYGACGLLRYKSRLGECCRVASWRRRQIAEASRHGGGARKVSAERRRQVALDWN